MITIAEALKTDLPREEAFEYVADFRNAAEWDPGLVSVERTSGGGNVGTTYAVVSRFRGREIDLVYEVADYRPPALIVLRGGGGRVEVLDRIEFHGVRDETRIVYVAEFRLRGFLRLAEPFMGGVLSELGRDAIAGLDAALRSGRDDAPT